MQDIFKQHSKELEEVLGALGSFHEEIGIVAKQLHEAFANGQRVFIAGNGGSAAEAQHFSDEMVGRYKEDRQSYPVVALTADSAVMTCIGNDYGFDNVFKRQLEGLGRSGDIFIGLSTSGNSKNILIAAEQAKRQGMIVIALTGPKGALKDIADYAIVSPTDTPARMQELHLHAIHLICETFEPSNVGKL